MSEQTTFFTTDAKCSQFLFALTLVARNKDYHISCVVCCGELRCISALAFQETAIILIIFVSIFANVRQST